jgi:hypothetical protein
MAAWSCITAHNEKTSDVFNVFHRSAIRNMFYLQSRVAALQTKQQRFDLEDYRFCGEGYDPDIFCTYFEPSDQNLQALEDRLANLEEHLKGNVNEEGNRASGMTTQFETTLEMNKARLSKIHERLLDLENPRKQPIALPQDLSWGPVSDRGPRSICGVPADFVQRTCSHESSYSVERKGWSAGSACTVSRTTCLCQEAHLKKREDDSKILRGPPSGNLHDVQRFQQRIRILEDYNRENGFDDSEKNQPRVPILAITLAARSWEDFEIFGSAEKMWERRRGWEELEGENPWPFDMSDIWVGKMRERFEVARDLQHALKEYCKWMVPCPLRKIKLICLRIQMKRLYSRIRSPHSNDQLPITLKRHF